jgi:DNA polymerase I-like protein with 3'-5' exonuclease and polymerase domains
VSTILELYDSAKIQRIDEAVINMEYNGFMVDAEYCARGYAVACQDEQAVLESLRGAVRGKDLTALVGQPDPDAIWTSSVQLPKLLEEGFGLPPSPYKMKGKVNLDAGQRSTDKRAMEWLLGRVGDDAAARRCIEGVVELRRVRNSAKYLKKFPTFIGPDGFIHPMCGPAGDDDDAVGALTGRLGMKKPEGQQVPKDPKKDRYFIRRAFVAPPGQKLVVADYSALEVVILANICDMLFGNTLLYDLTAPGQDIHAYNAKRIFGDLLGWSTDSGRRIADVTDLSQFKSDKELDWYRETVKAVWYKLQYGGTVHGFATSLKDKDGNLIGEARAREIVDALYAACPPIQLWHSWVRERLREWGGIQALDGRWVDYSHLISLGKWGFEKACRGADNAPMQGTGAGVIGAAMVDINESPELARLGALTQLQIHDELQLRVAEDHADYVGDVMKEIMEAAFPLKNLRVEVGIGYNWMEAKAPAKKAG